MCGGCGSRSARPISSTAPMRRWSPPSRRRWRRCGQRGADDHRVKAPSLRAVAAYTALVSRVEGAAIHANWMREHPGDYAIHLSRGCSAAMRSRGISMSRRCRGAAPCCGQFVAETLTGFDLVATPTLRTRVPTLAETDIDADPRTGRASWRSRPIPGRSTISACRPSASPAASTTAACRWPAIGRAALRRIDRAAGGGCLPARDRLASPGAGALKVGEEKGSRRVCSEQQRCPERFRVVRWRFRDVGKRWLIADHRVAAAGRLEHPLDRREVGCRRARSR